MDLFQNISKWFTIKIFSDTEAQTKITEEFKILILGEKGVGKTSICNKFLKNEFNLEVKPTMVSECYSKIVKLQEHTINLFVIDITQKVLSTDRSYLYSDAKGAFIVYDITKSKSFEELDKWIIDLKQNTQNNIPFVILGNKTDLQFLRNVEFEEGAQKANSHGTEFFETNCIDDDSVINAFKYMVAKIFYNEMPEKKKEVFKENLMRTLNEDENKNNLHPDSYHHSHDYGMEDKIILEKHLSEEVDEYVGGTDKKEVKSIKIHLAKEKNNSSDKNMEN